MPLSAGQTISFYEVLGTLGAGAMGEVYRARDTRLDREVAIKILPEAFASDDERLQRFEREAKTLAALNHQNIGAIYGLDRADKLRFLALELVPGSDLSDRLAKGALPMDEALALCRQIAEGLEAAHAAGVVHRDLKPDNVRVTPENQIKVVDFGLAKLTQTDSNEGLLSTEAGRIVGTPTYMSPEQARGRQVCMRTDVWAFGCILYECLTGRRPFAGESVPDVLGAIAEKEPDWNALPRSTPSNVRRLVQRCLTKDVRLRLQHIGEARIVLEHPDAVQADEATPSARLPILLLAALLLLGAAYWLGQLSGSEERPAAVTKLTVELPPNHNLDLPNPVSGGLAGVAPPLAIAPDGSAIVYAARIGTGVASLYYRRLADFEPVPLAGTEQAQVPFFSPTGEWVGFFRRGAIHKVPVGGGAPVEICKTSMFDRPSAAWGSDGTIVFTRGINAAGRLHRVSVGSGEVANLTEPNFSAGEIWHGMPQFLPGNESVLFTIATSTGKQAAVLHLDTLDIRVIEGTGEAAGARCLTGPDGCGSLVYAQDSRLFAVPFDPAAAVISGIPKPVLDSVSTSALGLAHWDYADNGTLAYISGGTAERHLVLRNRSGDDPHWRSEKEGLYQHPRFSRDGKSLLYDWERNRGGRQIWLYDIERNTAQSVTNGVRDMDPLWSPDGGKIVFSRNMGVSRVLFVVDPNDLGKDPQRLLTDTARADQIAGTWSKSGELLFTVSSGHASEDLWVLPDLDQSSATLFLGGAGEQGFGALSPDGQHLAYVSDELGDTTTSALDIFVCAYPSKGHRKRVTTYGGSEPLWSHDGKELFYRRGDSFWSVEMKRNGDTVTPAKHTLLFKGNYDSSPTGHQHYDVSRDGQTFALVESKQLVPNELRVILNWQPLAPGTAAQNR